MSLTAFKQLLNGAHSEGQICRTPQSCWWPKLQATPFRV